MRKEVIIFSLILLFLISFVSAFSWNNLLPSGISGNAVDEICVQKYLDDTCSGFGGIRERACRNSELRRQQGERICEVEEEKEKVSGGNFEINNEDEFIDSEIIKANYCLNGACYSSGVDYIIITRPMFINSLKSFIDFKTSQNFSVGVLTVEWINVSNIWNDTSINKDLLINKIKDKVQYFRKIEGVKYFLIVGDSALTNIIYVNADDLFKDDDFYSLSNENEYENYQKDSLEFSWAVPTGYFYREFTEGLSRRFSDSFFADPNNWDPDNDGINEAYAAVNSNWQDFAYVGRWPVRTVDEVINISQKTIFVENNLARGVYSQRAIMLSMHDFKEIDTEKCKYYELDNYPPNSVGFLTKIDCETGGSGIRASLGQIAKFYNFSDEDHSRVQTLAFERLFFGFNGIILYEYFHGNYNGISVAGNFYDISDIGRFDYAFPFLQTCSCRVWAFYAVDNSFDEALLKSSKGPAVVANPYFLYRFYNKFFNQGGSSVGEAFYYSIVLSEDMKQGVEEGHADTGYSTTDSAWLFGDPSLKISLGAIEGLPQQINPEITPNQKPIVKVPANLPQQKPTIIQRIRNFFKR